MWEMDYDKAAQVWIEKDKKYASMDAEAIRARIDVFVKAHNTCALAVASGEFVRCTPMEYNYVDGCFYFFSEGGLKFKALKDNKHVAIAIYEGYGGFNQLKSLQVMGVASMIEPFCDEYLKVVEHRRLPLEAIKSMPEPMNLIKVVPSSYDLLDSDLKEEEFGNRQHLDV